MAISQKTLEFLFENYIKNDKIWFAENRHRYKELVEEPMHQLSGELAEVMHEIDPLIETDPRRTLSRIWRDMRINRTGMHFRDSMWLSFRRGIGTEYPAFYFDVNQDGYSYGVGYYITPADVMDTIRQWVLRDDRRFLEAKKALEGLPHFRLSGQEYKKKKFPDAPEEKQLWLNRKGIYVGIDGQDLDFLYAENLGEALGREFRKLAPIYRLLLEAHLENR